LAASLVVNPTAPTVTMPVIAEPAAATALVMDSAAAAAEGQIYYMLVDEDSAALDNQTILIGKLWHGLRR